MSPHQTPYVFIPNTLCLFPKGLMSLHVRTGANHAQRHQHANSDQLLRTQPCTCRQIAAEEVETQSNRRHAAKINPPSASERHGQAHSEEQEQHTRFNQLHREKRHTPINRIWKAPLWIGHAPRARHAIATPAQKAPDASDRLPQRQGRQQRIQQVVSANPAHSPVASKEQNHAKQETHKRQAKASRTTSTPCPPISREQGISDHGTNNAHH